MKKSKIKNLIGILILYIAPIIIFVIATKLVTKNENQEYAVYLFLGIPFIFLILFIEKRKNERTKRYYEKIEKTFREV
ncbi:MAG: hypothetical protein NDI62_03475 [Burkholderiales bacterium]|nr:hypothetical protein [Burkholderiales bacterium]